MNTRFTYCNDRKMIDTGSTGSGQQHLIPCPECSGCSGCKEKQQRIEELKTELDKAERVYRAAIAKNVQRLIEKDKHIEELEAGWILIRQIADMNGIDCLMNALNKLPVTKFNAYVDSVADLPLLMRQAFREATSGAPGPVHLGMTGLTGEIVEDAEAELDVVIEDRFAELPPFRPEPDATQVARAANVLQAAQRPVLIAGGGVTASGARAQVVQLAEMLSIPVATSLNAKGTIREDHPLVAKAGAVVGRIPQPPGSIGHIEFHRVGRVYRQVHHPAAHDTGADVFQLEVLDQGVFGHCLPLFQGLFDGQGRGGRQLRLDGGYGKQENKAS